LSAVERLLPAALTRGLSRVEDGLLVARYRAGLAALGVPVPPDCAFHVDAAGWSPEVADALRDPFYLGAGPLEARALVLGAAQLGAPLVHPGLGFGAEAFRAALAAHGSALAALTLRDVVLVEIEAEGAPLAEPRQLADPAALVVRLRTPGGLVEGARRLEAMSREFLESERRWLEDEFIAEMTALAARVRDLPALPAEVTRHPLGPLFFCAAFGGAYVIEEPGASLVSATTCVLVADAGCAAGDPRVSRRGRRVELLPLTVESGLEVLERHRIARLDLAFFRERPGALDRLRHWLAADVRLGRDPERAPELLGPADVAQTLRGDGELPEAHRELEDVAHRLRSARAPIDPSALAPLTRLRLTRPTARRPEVRRFVRHLQAFLDPVDPGRAWVDAPDLFFARLPRLAASRRAYLEHWLAAHGDALRSEAASAE
jgi:hypothetical protein